MTIQELLDKAQTHVDFAIQNYLPAKTEQPEQFYKALHYVMFNGGKRFRPLLVYAAGEIYEVPWKHLNAPAASVEMIHTYSLVHDDLPAMDNDDLRRGKPTCHIEFDEATAILVGDALNTLAFEVLCNQNNPKLCHAAQLQMIQTLSHASGINGMVKGQAIDIAFEGKLLDEENLENMHLLKTGALIRASVLLGALASNKATQNELKQLDSFATALGLAFQIQDDILDVIGETEHIGKPVGSDAQKNKPTYPSIIGLEQAKKLAVKYKEIALLHLKDFGPSCNSLRTLTDFVVKRVS